MVPGERDNRLIPLRRAFWSKIPPPPPSFLFSSRQKAYNTRASFFYILAIICT